MLLLNCLYRSKFGSDDSSTEKDKDMSGIALSSRICHSHYLSKCRERHKSDTKFLIVVVPRFCIHKGKSSIESFSGFDVIVVLYLFLWRVFRCVSIDATLLRYLEYDTKVEWKVFQGIDNYLYYGCVVLWLFFRCVYIKILHYKGVQNMTQKRHRKFARGLLFTLIVIE